MCIVEAFYLALFISHTCRIIIISFRLVKPSQEDRFEYFDFEGFLCFIFDINTIEKERKIEIQMHRKGESNWQNFLKLYVCLSI